MSHYLPNLSFL